MNELERILTGGGQVFKKKAKEETGERRPKLSGSGSAKHKAGFKLKKALRNTKKKK